MGKDAMDENNTAEPELVADGTSDDDEVIEGIDPQISQSPMPHPGLD